MNDLISRSSLIKKLENVEVKIDYEALKNFVDVAKDEDVLETIITYAMWNTNEIVMKYIKEEPTVYDIDKVLKELESEARFYNSASNSDQCVRYGIKKAIGIVEDGGVNK